MPWSKNSDLPKGVREGRSKKQQRAFRHGFDSAEEQGLSEASKWKIAYHAAKGAKGKKKAVKSFRNFYEQMLYEAGKLREEDLE